MRGKDTARGMPALAPVLALIAATFIGIMVYVWVEAKKADPQMLDEQGRVKRGALARRTGARV